MSLELEEDDRFIDIEKDPYGRLIFRILFSDGKTFPAHRLPETVLAKKSRKRLRKAYEDLVKANPGMDD